LTGPRTPRRRNSRARRRVRLAVLEVVIVLILLVFLYPFAIVVFNSFKSISELLVNPLGVPSALRPENYVNAVEKMNYLRGFENTALATLLGTAGIVIFGSMAGYMLSRTKTRLSAVLFAVSIVPMIMPFQSFMITLTRVAKILHLSNSIPGLAVLYWGLGIPFVIFLYHGFIKTIPLEIDESAALDGASRYRIFFRIVFPLLTPVSATAIALDVMWIWNDFLLPLIMVNANRATKTLQLSLYSFFGQYISEWHFAMAGLVLAVGPSLIVFILLQRYVISGVTAGAVKG
jgi:raffinose/stachyose/melibiose transport system permease protein